MASIDFEQEGFLEAPPEFPREVLKIVKKLADGNKGEVHLCEATLPYDGGENGIIRSGKINYYSI